MGRSRSRSRSVSPVRRKRRAKEKSKRKRSESREDIRHDKTRRDKRRRSNSKDDVSHSRRRSRSRSRSYERRHRSPYPSTSKSKISTVNVSASDLEGKTPDEIEMMKVMGFCGFDTTKGKKVDGNNAGEVHVILKRKYRQYMNRKGGFNRPLDFVA